MFLRRPMPQAAAEEMTEIWSCENEDCNCWMRSGFSFEDEPVCAVCGSSMQRTTRMLPPLSDEFSGPGYAGRR